MGEQRSRSATSARGQHFLVPRIASDLVRNAGITRGDLVVEFGAGTGVLTRELAARAGRVIAIELDPKLASKLTRSSARNTRVVGGDATTVQLPREPFRVVANIPFGATAAIVRRLVDPRGQLMRADLVVQWGAAVKRCSMRPSTMQTIAAAPWFEFTLTRRLPASSFRPPPSVDAAVMTITRRPDSLLAVHEVRAFEDFVEHRFGRTPNATDLDVWEWVQLFRHRRAPHSRYLAR